MPLQSGLTVSDEVLKLFSDMKIGSKNTRYILLKLNEDHTVVNVDKVGQKKSPDTQREEYEEMLKGLNMKEGRFIILDINIGSLQAKDKLFCIMWNPDDSGTKLKMLYASALQTVVSKLKMDEGGIVIQANDLDEVSWESVLEKAKK